ncbi:hypothetical protein HELRODRAFT_79043 [Helobdella robusta]|uniref:ABC transporter domain-containing protein n=1 Tax=Helobdella robusta TaxID=6412 RepID=T1G3J1_HELRO|nr:hypothetical protein HELRODRAFT_79043 [Helobdella robusta]ESO04543.1 hypothetical protein HELRODRAFT_79043 [Helobdella robusta]
MCLCRIVGLIVTEKHLKLRDFMKVMGLMDSAYWLSWIITFVVLYTLPVIGVSYILCVSSGAGGDVIGFLAGIRSVFQSVLVFLDGFLLEVGIQASNIGKHPILENGFNVQSCMVGMTVDTIVTWVLILYFSEVMPGLCFFPKVPFPSVDHLTVDFYKNQITAFLGHNGAGKSTTMSIMAGLLEPQGGTIYVDGMDVRTDMAKIRKRFSLCPQHDILFDCMTVEQHMFFYGQMRGLTIAVTKAESDQIITNLNLTNKRKARANELSGGMRRLLSIGIAYLGSPGTVVLDEPSTGVDAHTRRAIWSLLQTYRAGRTTLISTHAMDEADIVSDRITIIWKGQLCCSGSSMFLKNMFSDGYKLSIELIASITKATLKRRFIPTIFPDSKLHSESKVSNEISFILPLDSPVKEFLILFEVIEERKKKLGIKSYGLSSPGLEEVCVRVVVKPAKPAAVDHAIGDSDVRKEESRTNSTGRKDTLVVMGVLIGRFFGKSAQDRKAVMGITFAVKKGECFGLLGTNGAGKSTLFKMITGEINPTCGDASINSNSVTKNRKEAQKCLGYCPQFDALCSRMTVREHLTMFALFRGSPKPESVCVRLFVCLYVGVCVFAFFEHFLPFNLSGGNRRKLSVALALIGNPNLVCLDEPTTGVDPGARAYVWKAIEGASDNGLSVLLTTHSMEECEALCHRITIQVAGRLTCLGSIQHVKTRYNEGYTISVKFSILPKQEMANQIAQLKSFVKSKLNYLNLENSSFNLLTYKAVMTSAMLGEVFSIFSNIKEKKMIEDFAISQTTLEQVGW